MRSVERPDFHAARQNWSADSAQHLQPTRSSCEKSRFLWLIAPLGFLSSACGGDTINPVSDNSSGTSAAGNGGSQLRLGDRRQRWLGRRQLGVGGSAGSSWSTARRATPRQERMAAPVALAVLVALRTAEMTLRMPRPSRRREARVALASQQRADRTGTETVVRPAW